MHINTHTYTHSLSQCLSVMHYDHLFHTPGIETHYKSPEKKKKKVMWKKTFRSHSLGIKRGREDGKFQSDTEKQKGRDRLKEKHNKRNNFHTFMSKKPPEDTNLKRQ